MSLPSALRERLSIPLITAPMFLSSGPDLVVSACRSGVIGTFPALNQRTTEGYEAWLREIEERLAAAEQEGVRCAPFGVNLIMHASNQRLAADVEVTVKHKVPIVITSLGAASELVQRVHAYGGLVFHDVATIRHAHKAAQAGVDGLIAVCAGAGGHGGSLNPFAFLSEIRDFFDRTVILAGAISTGRDVAAACMMGADLAYVGTRFIATEESLSPAGHKQMILESSSADIVNTDHFSGIPANFLRPSIVASGFDPDRLGGIEKPEMRSEVKAWKTIWAAGQGVGAVKSIGSVATVCAQIRREFETAVEGCAGLGGRRVPAGRAAVAI